MNGVTNKTKIIIVIVGFIIFAVLMFTFGYKILGDKNQTLADGAAEQHKQLEVLQREQRSFEQGKKDLANLKDSAYPPEDLFSSDTKVVKEIQQMEDAAQRYGLEMKLSVTGTQKTALRVPNTASELYTVPYTLTLDGNFGNAIQFMQAAEHMPFVTHTQNISVKVGDKNKTTTLISSEFFIKK